MEALREELLRTHDLLQQREQEVRVVLAAQRAPMLLPDARLEVEELEAMLLAAQNKVCACERARDRDREKECLSVSANE